MTLQLDDALERERAATTFNQNVVVTAGAGTGKTRLLVDRLVHLLVKEPDPVAITEIVALTFTNKAANEMKIRLRQRLQAYLSSHLERDPASETDQEVQREVKALINRYHLGKDEIDHRIREALRHLERSEIGTIHSFAATLLRLYPVEAGLDPQFQEDEGGRFERYFEEKWEIWLDGELSLQGPRRDRWKSALLKVSLEEIHDLALALCSETVPLKRLADQSRETNMPQPIRDWLKGLEQEASELTARHPAERKIEKLTRSARLVIQEVLAHGDARAGVLGEEKAMILSAKDPPKVKDWDDLDREQAGVLIRVARRLLHWNRDLMELLCELLIPFVEECRKGFLKEGYISFDGLLVRARDLVRDRPSVREELKKKFKAILIDEFQDTDPIQYEMLLYLTERPGRQSRDWRKVKLMPGKIFVVGDPKQSIYAFRRADIEAYLHVVKEVIEGQNGIQCALTTNFRSHQGILNVVNGVFDQLIRPREGLQPPYIPIYSPEERGDDSPVGSGPLPFRKVELRLVRSEEGKLDADSARRLEAEALARWLSEKVLGKAIILERNGCPMKVQARHVAILMRTLTHVHQYLEPLRRRRIRYVVEGERHFYATQEVIDAVNLLRVIDNPYDTLALVGVLRSPIGGMSDAEIYELRQQHLLDYQTVARPDAVLGTKVGSSVKGLYEILDRLHQTTRKLPVGEAVGRILDEIPLTVLAAQSFHGEQAVANIEKVRRLAEEMGQEGQATLKEVIAMLERRVSEVRAEGESALAEETVDAVRILSVHKAKGLEFPVVVLAGCHAGGDGRRGDAVDVQHDWSTDLVGLRVGDDWNLSGIFLAEKVRLREAEERKRLLYVAMTRARDCLMISCAPTVRGGGGSFLEMLEEVTGDLRRLQESDTIAVRDGTMELNVVKERPRPPRVVQAEEKRDRPRIHWAAYANEWKERIKRYDAIIGRPFFVTPTLLKHREAEQAEGAPQRERGRWAGNQAALVGQLAHRFLQDWDFSTDPGTFRERLARLLDCSRAGRGMNLGAVHAELEEIFEVFFRSGAYEELLSSRILGREVPLLISWDGQIMEGFIDLIYEKDGRLYVADYKTDRITENDLSQVAESYHHQARIYPEAVRRSLKRDVAGFKLIFLRLGEAIRI